MEEDTGGPVNPSVAKRRSSRLNPRAATPRAATPRPITPPKKPGISKILGGTPQNPERVSLLIKHGMVNAIQQVMEGGQDHVAPTPRNIQVGLNGLVVCSYRQGVVVESLDVDIVASRVAYWKDFVDSIEQVVVGSGTYNSVSSVNCEHVGIPETFWSDVYPGLNDDTPARLAIRKSFRVQTKRHAAEEIFLQCYCASLRIGPRVFCAFYTDYQLSRPTADSDPDDMEFDDLQNHDDVPYTICKCEPYLPKLKPLQGNVQSSASVSELWSGSLDALFKKWWEAAELKSSPPKQGAFKEVLRATNFAEKFVNVVHDAAKAGIFHGDIKNANMLYDVSSRVGDRSFKLCLTDFDPQYCLLIPPQERDADIERCMAMAMVAMFLGMNACYNSFIHEELRDPLNAALIAKYGEVFESTRANRASCAFLAATSRIANANGTKLPIPIPPDTSPALKTLSETFQRMVAHYAGGEKTHNDSTKNTQCFKLEADQPLFHQLLEYCFGQVLAKPRS